MTTTNTRTVLLVGGTGRTGSRVLDQLLRRGANVRAIVRSVARVPAELRVHENLTLIEADMLSMPQSELTEAVAGCDAIVSCLGHNISLRGVVGPPYDLVTAATKRLCRTAELLEPVQPIKFVLMSSVSVNRPSGLDTRRGTGERAFLAFLRAVLPPANDNQRAADCLCGTIGTANPYIEWVAVRPDSLLDGDVSDYSLHEGLVSSLFKPDSTNMANVAQFMSDLVTDSALWDTWKGKLPVIVNV